MGNKIVQRLKALLETERAALLCGDLVTVESLLAEKMELAEALGNVNHVELRSLSRDLARNGALLSAARDGVSDVLTVLRKQRAAKTVLSTYDSSGKPSQIASSTSGTERRF